MHGRDHRPGGSDPIPGLTSGGGSVDNQTVTFDEHITSTALHTVGIVAGSGASLFTTGTTAPACLVAGTYAIEATVFISGTLTSGGDGFNTALTLGANTGNIAALARKAITPTTSESGIQDTISGTWYFGVGDTFELSYLNGDSASHDFTGSVFIQTCNGDGLGSGIRFDVTNTGGYLDVVTNGSGIPASNGFISFADNSGAGVYLASVSGPGGGGFIGFSCDGLVSTSSEGFEVLAHGGDITFANTEVFSIINSPVGQFYLQTGSINILGGAIAVAASSSIALAADEGITIDPDSDIDGVGWLTILNLPSSPSGLTAGQVWNNSGVLNIV